MQHSAVGDGGPETGDGRHRARGLGACDVCRRTDKQKKSAPPFLRRKDIRMARDKAP